MSGVRRLLSASLTAALAGVMAACMGGGALSTGTAAPPPSAAEQAATMVPQSPSETAAIRIELSGKAPDAIVLNGETAWVLAGEGGTLMEVDLRTAREVRSISVGLGATHLAVPRSGLAAIGRFDNSGAGYLPVVDLETGAVSGISTGALGGLAGGDEGVIWALEKTGRLLKVDVLSRRVIDETAVRIGQNVHTEVQWGAGSAWVGSDGTPVTRIAGDDLAVEATIAVDTGLPFLVRGGLVWGAGPEQLWSIDQGTNQVAQRIELNNVFEVLAVDVDGDEAWLAIRHSPNVGAVVRLDLPAGTVAAEYPVSLPAAVKIGRDRVWVASYLANELLGFAR